MAKKTQQVAKKSIHDEIIYSNVGTEPGKLYGSVEPRVWTKPLRELTPETSLGFAAVEFASEILEISLHPWQKWLLVHALETLPDGNFRYRTVTVLIARQSGKSTVSQVLSLFFLYVLGINLVLGTAQDLDTAEEVWEGALEMIEGNEELAALALPPIKVNGKKTIRLKTGERYKVKAASRKAGRGLSGDLIILDETREQTDWSAWSAVTHTTMARPNAQIWALSNAGDAASVVLRYLRKMAHKALGDPDGIVSGEDPSLLLDPEAGDGAEVQADETLGLFEWSAPPGRPVEDREGWQMANPSLGYTIAERTLESACKTEPEWVFRCLDVATPTLTAEGWKTMGSVQVGDQVKGLDGTWVDVTGVSPVYYDRDCYKITFNDGRTIVCDDQHLWMVKDRRRWNPKFEIVRTADLIERGVTYHNPSMDYDVRNFTLPKVAALDGPDVDLPIPPYLLGLWLGDGACRASWVAIEDRDEAHVSEMIEHSGATVTKRVKDSENCWRVSFNLGRYGDFTGKLHELGIYRNKHIPDVYLTASREQRLWLLRGLMDSDGTVSKLGQCTFTNTNGELVAGVRTLVRSLGWKTSDKEPGRYGKAHWLPRYDVGFKPRPDEPCPVSIPRKAANIKPARSYRDVRPMTIVSIEPVPSVPVRCIKVDADDHMFLAGDLIPTHNTECLCQWSDGTLEGPFPAGAWDSGIDPACKGETCDRCAKQEHEPNHPGSSIADGNEIALCVDVNWDRTRSHIAAAGLRSDGLPHVEVIASRAGIDWVKTWFGDPEHRERLRYRVALQPNGPAGALLDELKAIGVQIVEWSGGELGRSCGRFYDLVSEGHLRHLPQPLLDVAAATAVTRPLGDAWVWDRKKSPVDCSPLVAVTGACWLIAPKPEEGPPAVTGWDEDLIAQWEREALLP